MREMEDHQTTHTGEDDEEITQEDSWHVISGFFEEKGLVRQQLESFDDFLQYKMQDIVDEDPTIVLTPEAQHMPGQTAAQTQVRLLASVLSGVSLTKRGAAPLRNPIQSGLAE